MPKFGITCEVGVAFGGFSQKIVEICQPKKHFLIDAWNQQGRYDETAYNSVLEKFSKGLKSGQVEIIRNNSVDGIKLLKDNSIDFIYIDTDHTYKSTKMELIASIEKMKPGGIISGHDYKAQGRYDYESKQLIPYGVVEAVQEFIIEYDYDLVYLTNEVDGFLSFSLKKRHPRVNDGN
jgi:predicted O-methyltransferase YrrM